MSDCAKDELSDCAAPSGLVFRSISRSFPQGVALGWYVVAPGGAANGATPEGPHWC